MNLFSPILRLFGMGAVSNPDTGAQSAGPSGTATETGISVTDEQALRVSAVWACVQLISNSVASLPINFYTKTKTGRDELDRNPLTDLFHNSPNAWMKPRDFRLSMTTQMALWNNAYAEIKYSGKRPVALIPLRPGRMTPFIDGNGELTYHYVVSSGGNASGVKIFSKKSILHLKGFGSDGVVGFDRSSYARESLGLSVSANIFAAAQFANGGRSGGGVLTFDDFLTDPQRKQARKMYEDISKTAYNTNKLWLLEGGVKYDPDRIKPDNMQMIETRQMQLSEVARFYGVPEVLIGAGANSSSAWPASFEGQQNHFLQYTLQPYLDEWESAIFESLITDREQFADHDVSGFIKMDATTRATYLSSLVQNGLSTRNEARRKLNLPDDPDGNALTVQVNLTPIDKLQEIGDAPQNKQPA